MHHISLPEFARTRGRLLHPPKALDPRRTAVIAIDFQRFFIDDGEPMGHVHARDALAAANRLHAAVRDAGGLVVFTQHSMAPAEAAASGTAPAGALLPGSPSYELHPDLVRAPTDVLVVKRRSSPLHPQADTDLEQQLRARGINTVIVTGLVTNGCCDCTARDAFQYGFDVIVASEATAAMSDEEHNAALLGLELYYARVLDNAEIALALRGD